MKVISWAVTVLLILGFIVALPMINWGSLSIRPPQTITVVGTAESQEANQVASFYAGIWATNADRQAAINEANQQIDQVMAALQEFGIPEADVQTQNVSVYQESYPVDGGQRYERGEWRASNSIVVTLREIERANELVSLLGESGLSDISGPNFRIDNSAAAQQKLLTAAIENAREKAELIAGDQNKQIIRTLSITEGVLSNGASPFAAMRMEGGAGGGLDLAPGSSTVSTSVTVMFEMR